MLLGPMLRFLMMWYCFQTLKTLGNWHQLFQLQWQEFQEGFGFAWCRKLIWCSSEYILQQLHLNSFVITHYESRWRFHFVACITYRVHLILLPHAINAIAKTKSRYKGSNTILTNVSWPFQTLAMDLKVSKALIVQPSPRFRIALMTIECFSWLIYIESDLSSQVTSKWSTRQP